MINVGTKEINISNLRLRRLTKEDASGMFNNWCNDPLVTRYLPWNIHKNIDVTNSLLDMWIKEYDSLDTYRWIVEDTTNNELVGTIDVVKKDDANKVMEIGHCYRRDYWGKGVATNVLKTVIDFLFENTDVELIFAKHVEPNIGSGKVMQKCGMTYEATLRERFIDKVTGERLNVIVYSINRKEHDTNK